MAGEMILMIDGCADTRPLPSLRLKAEGCRTAFAADALKAITRACQAQPAVILLQSGSPGRPEGTVCHPAGAGATHACSGRRGLGGHLRSSPDVLACETQHNLTI